MLKNRRHVFRLIALLFMLTVTVPLLPCENEEGNKVFELASNGDMPYLETGLLFYSYLNDKEDDFLSKHDFGRDEIKDGLNELISRYNHTWFYKFGF